MPKPWSTLKIEVPTFKDADKFLEACGLIIVKQIVASIDAGRRPDGSMQKQNNPDYARRKFGVMGYHTPVKGMKTHGTDKSPYIARHSYVAWLRDFLPPDKLRIHLNRYRAEVSRRLAEKGYWFVGINKESERQIAKRTWQYLQTKVKQMASGKKV